MAVGLDKRAAPDVPLNQPFGFQLRVSVRYRCAMNAQHGRQLAARRDAVAGAQITGMHERAQLIAKLDVQRNVTLRLEMKWQHCLSPSANSTRDWTASRANLSSALPPLRPAQHQPVHASAHVSEVGLVAPFEFGNGAPRVADFTKSLTHGLPVHVAVTEVHPLISILLALEVLQVDLDDALPQRANPVLRIAVKHHVSNVEPGLDPRTLEFSYVRGHLQGAQQKLVPDLFDGDHNFQLLSERKELANLPLRTTPGVAIGGLRIGDGRDKQHRIRTPYFGVVQGRAHPRQALFHHR